MTVNTNLSRQQYNGNSSTTAFTFATRILNKSHVKVIRTVVATGADTTLTLDDTGADGYSVSGVGGTSCTINTVAAPATGTRLTIVRNVPFTQTADYVANDPFPAETHEDALDKGVMIDQQIYEAQSRGLKLTETTTFSGDLLMADPSGGKLLGWNADGTAIVNYSVADIDAAAVTDYMATVLTAANAADARTALAAAASGANSDITSLTAVTSINGGAFGGFRNPVINGDHRVAQNNTVAIVNNAVTYGGPDQFFGNPQSFTTATGNLVQYSGVATASGYAAGVSLTTTGSGDLFFGTRLESKDAIFFNGDQAFYSFIAYQNTGSAVSVFPSIYKANALDDFSATTSLAVGGAVSVPSGVPTLVTQAITFGASDCSNGLQLFQQFSSIGAVTAKDFWVGNVQMPLGSVLTAFEQIPYAVQYALCQRYLPAITSTSAVSILPGAGLAASTTNVVFNVPLKVPARKAPTGIAVSSAAHFTVGDGVTNTACNAATFNAASPDAVNINLSVAAGLTQFRPYYAYANSASGKILLTGCQL